MLRFSRIDKRDEYLFTEDRGTILFDGNIWEQGRKFFSRDHSDTCVPVVDQDGRKIALAWQDDMANQELRMLDEIIRYGESCLHFEEFYSDCDCVVIHECNELSYCLANYLQLRKIPVVLEGRYWKYTDVCGDSWDEERYRNEMHIYAEGTWGSTGAILESIRSVSVEFDCIYNLYMKNVREGRIPLISRTPEQLFAYLRDKNVFLIGTGHDTQDAYDVLLAHGVDIAGFLGDKKDFLGMKVLGKESYFVEELNSFANPVVIDCENENSVLGDGGLDIWVYRGYRRDMEYIYLKDYTEIPKTSMLHVLRDKTIVLVGDELLCRRLRRFWLNNGKRKNTVLLYSEYNENACREPDILGLTVLIERIPVTFELKSEIRELCGKLKMKGIESVTDYYTDFERMVKVDIMLQQKQSSQLAWKPKGFILGYLNGYSGNMFIWGCIEGHPNIVVPEFDRFDNYVFWYSVRLAEVEKEDILTEFWNIYIRDELNFIECPSDRELFNEECKRLLFSVEGDPSSHELFVIFQLAYLRMKGRTIEDISKCYMFIELHSLVLHRRQMFFEWLLEEGIACFVLSGVRDSVRRTGSIIKRNHLPEHIYVELYGRRGQIQVLLKDEKKEYKFKGHEIKIIEMKFEEIKLHPKEEWKKFCDKLV